MGRSSEPDFAVINAALRSSGLLGEPAELHGEFCGLVCIMGPDAGPAWVASVLADSDTAAGDIHAGEIHAREIHTREIQKTLESLAVTTWNALDSGDMELILLLPDDAEQLESRAESLGFWCQGFMHGLGAGSEPDTDSPLLAEGIIREIITDFSEITRAAFTTDETEAEAEAAYLELVEFVRVSVQLAFEELYRVRKSPKREQRH
jgi:uncharacterized protein YgfB (UPF0149 family)